MTKLAPAAREAVTAAEIIRNFGFWQQQALIHPVTITHHGRARVLLISADEFDRMRSNSGSPAFGATVSEDGAALRWVSVLDNMVEGFLLLDRDLRLLEMNRVAEAYYGVDRAELLGKVLSEAIPDSAQSFITDWIKRVQRTGEIASFDATSALFPERKIAARVFPVMGNVAVLFLNITEQEHLRDQSAEWQACYDVMAQHPGVSVARLDGRGRVISADNAFVRFTGFSAAELSHVRVFDIVAPAARRRLQTAFEDLMAHRRPADLELAIMAKSGDEQMAHVSLAPIARDFAVQGAMMLLSGAVAAQTRV